MKSLVLSRVLKSFEELLLWVVGKGGLPAAPAPAPAAERAQKREKEER